MRPRTVQVYRCQGLAIRHGLTTAPLPALSVLLTHPFSAGPECTDMSQYEEPMTSNGFKSVAWP